MRKFVPICDKLLSAQGEVTGRIVPFKPEFLLVDVEIEVEKNPVNWIPDTDYDQACERLDQIDRSSIELAPA
ncbi:MAG: hypothetical protein ABGY96_16190 [bacterium]|nr:hypothetical protein [Gammaproteobacteria bacterium]HIL97445.1 hypothetical protein [Pseudomonadales bacterium]